MKKLLVITGLLLSASVYAVPTLTIGSIPATCFGFCDGQAVVIPSGGTGSYSYAWSPGGGTGSSVTGLCAGSYTVTVTDNGDMSTATASVVVTEPSPLAIAPMPASLICFGDCASITPTASGGTPPYAYVWTGFTGPATLTVCPTGTTTYTLTVTDGNGCNAYDVTTVAVSPPITASATSTNTTGCVTCDGTATITPTGGSPPYVYNWSSAAGTTASVSSLCAGSYTVNIVDNNGCAATDSTIVFANNDAIANFTMVPDSTNAYNFFAFNSSIGTGNAYVWEWGDGTPLSTLANPSHTYTAPGVMTVCLIASNFLCGADTLCQPVTVTGVLASCNALFNIADDTLNPDPNAHYVYNLSYGATLSYLWDFGDGTTSTSMTPSHVYAGTGPYLLCLSINDGAGCTDMYCDSLISADSLNREGGTMQLSVYDLPTFYTSTAGIANNAEMGNVTVAPNPFNETTLFSVNSKQAYSFELADVLGKKVKMITGLSEKEFELSRSGLDNGIYFYKIYTAERLIGMGKVVIK